MHVGDAAKRALPLFAVVALVACSTYRDQLVRSQRAFDQTDYDRSLALLRDLEPDVRRLTTPEQAEYAYLRGMSDYRIGYRQDARHWLALARSYEESQPGMIPSDWKARVNEALDELNATVYQEGIGALTTSRRSESGDEPKSDRREPRRRDDSSAKEPGPAAPPAKEEPPKAEPPKKEEAPLPKKDEAPLPKKDEAPKKPDAK